MSLPAPPGINSNSAMDLGYHQGCECVLEAGGSREDEADTEDLSDDANLSEFSDHQQPSEGESESGLVLDEPEMLRTTMPTGTKKKRENKHQPIYNDDDGRLMNPEGILLDSQAPYRYDVTGQPGKNQTEKLKHARMEEQKADIGRVTQALLYSSCVTVKDLTQDALNSRKKGPSYTITAGKMHKEMNESLDRGEGEIIATTCRVVDSDGTLLVSYYGHHIESSHGRSKERNATGTWLGVNQKLEADKREALRPRMFKDEASILKWIEEENPVWDGLQPHCQENIAWHTQHYCNLCLIEKSRDNQRYAKGNGFEGNAPPDLYQGEHKEWMRIKSKIPPQCTEFIGSHLRGLKVATAREQYQERKDSGEASNTMETEEPLEYLVRVGVRFLDRCWPVQGFPKALTTSDDLTGGCCYQTDAAMTYMRTTNQYIQELLTPYVVGAVGKREYQAMRKAFRAAAMDAEEEDCMGFHTGQAICYNEVVLQHMDAADSGYCVIFCVGSHRGGFLYLPDMNRTFFYCPGTVIVFKSSLLYHGITKWAPSGDIKANGLLPGRISVVLYTKKGSFDVLKTKKPGYVNRGRGGMMAMEDPAQTKERPKDVVETDLYKPLLQATGNWWNTRRNKEADMVVEWKPVGPTKSQKA